MINAVPLWLVVAQALSTPAPAPDASRPHAIVQTVRADARGETTVETRAADPGVATVRAVQRGGPVMEAVSRGETRVLIELRERPTHDRHKPGSPGEAGRQRAALARDLAGIDARLETRRPAKIKRNFETLFSGVAATIDPAALPEIKRLPYVVGVHADVEVRAQLADSVSLIGATSVAATYGVDGAGVTVAVIDTGIDYTHADLGGCFGVSCKVKGGYDFVNDDADPQDDHGHGTHVAGIVAANGTARGVAPGASLLAYKVLGADGSGDTSDIIAAIEQAVLAGAKIANLSIGGPGDPDDPTSQAIDNATAAGMLSVVAAGNNGSSYQTIDSPGVARTALTVGAVSKTGEIAWFSSRGYVSDGTSYMMKPEVTAPGVSIRSTLPASGAMSSATGYGEADGTSMATPHVAGAAALLLQWKPAQTPADLKHRLVTSANAGPEDPFTEGAGRVNLVRAFALSVLPSATHVAFGVAAATSGLVQFERTISIRNTTNAAQTVTLAAAAPAFPAGTTMTIVPSSVPLAAGQSANVTVKLQVDGAVTPEAPDPLAWSSTLSMTAGGQTATVPVYFFRASVLNLTFDEAPWIVYVASAEQGVFTWFHRPGPSFSVAVKRGKWDVLVLYEGEPLTVVAREHLDVQGQLSLSFQRSEATRKISILPVDEAQQPLGFDMSATLALGLKQSPNADGIDILFSLGSFGEFRVSPLSARYAVGVIAGGPAAAGKKFFTYSWTGSGLASDVNLPVAGVPLRPLGLSGARPHGADKGLLTHLIGSAARFSDGSGGGFFGGSAYFDELDWTVYFQSTVAPGLPLLMAHLPFLQGYDYSDALRDFTAGTYLRHLGGTDIIADQSAFFDLLDSLRAPDAVLGPATKRWDVDTPPSSLTLEMWNGTEWVFGFGRAGTPWVTHTASQRKMVEGAAPAFTLYRNGALVGSYPLPQLWQSVPTTPGRHELHATMPYRVGGMAGSSNATLTFDTAKSDPNPPRIDGFRVEQSGQRTGTPTTPSAAANTSVKFSATDDESVAGVLLEWRQFNTAAWTTLPLSISGGEYVAPFGLEGAIDLRLTVTDTAGNQFQETWTPAVVTTGSAPPTRPASVTAIRSGSANAVSISWTPSSSSAGVAHYRVERLPGGASFKTNGPVTTFLDGNGLVPGNTYSYRVVAVDQNGVDSAPSGYDGVSLISFQNDPAVPGIRIRGVHVGELRRAVDSARNAAGLPAAWGSYDPATGVVKAADFLELRDRLNAARSALGLTAVQFSVPVSAGGVIRASAVQQLRDSLK